MQKPPVLDRAASPTGLSWAALIIFVVAVAIVAVRFDLREPLLMGGILFAIAGWLFTSAIALRSRVKQHTFDLIFRTRFDQSYKDSAFAVRVSFDNATVIDEKAAKKIFNAATSDENEIRRHIGNVLNFYEILAISIAFGDGDELILKEYFRDLVLAHYKKTQHFVPLWRQEDKQAFVYLENLYNKWSS